MEESEIHDEMSKIVNLLTEPKSGCQLLSANRIYGQDGLSLEKDFVRILAKYYKSEFQSVDFITEGENVRQTINRWAEEITKNHIKDLLAPGILNENTRLVLANAIYFKGDWKHIFDRQNTREATFYSAKDRETKVQMMSQKEEFLYYENREVKVLGMPYKARHLAMFVFLPRDKYGLQKFEQNLTGESFLRLMRKAAYETVEVRMPKFKLEQSFKLNEALGKLGMKDMFLEDVADFTKVTGNKDLYVSAVVHKACVEVNEEGSEAAAASAVVEAERCLPMRFKADHPFMFCIFHKKTRCLLFTGCFTN